MPRVCARTAIGPNRRGAYFTGAVGVGPVGSVTMTRVVIFRDVDPVVNTAPYLFNARSANGGWAFYRQGTTLKFDCRNAPNTGTASVNITWERDTTYLAIGTFDGATVSLFVLNVTATPVTAALAGFAASGSGVAALCYSTSPASTLYWASGMALLEAYASDGYLLPSADLVAYATAGVAAVENGQDFPYPRAAVAGQDWYWSAEDWDGSSDWLDRINGFAMTPNAPGDTPIASVPARFI